VTLYPARFASRALQHKRCHYRYAGRPTKEQSSWKTTVSTTSRPQGRSAKPLCEPEETTIRTATPTTQKPNFPRENRAGLRDSVCALAVVPPSGAGAR